MNCNNCANEVNTNYQRIDIDGSPNENGKYILFGSYPQTMVRDEELESALDDIAGRMDTGLGRNGWISYEYYIAGEKLDYMWYKDIEYNGEKYRGVCFDKFRPYYTTNSSVPGNSFQHKNGFYRFIRYYFKYEPLKWRILTESNGRAKLLCESIIDSQHYDFSDYSNNYENSDIRKWLNSHFYETAFTQLQRQIIELTTVDNSERSTNPYQNATEWNDGKNSNVCADTQDNVFLLSWYEVTNPNYGFGLHNDFDSLRHRKRTEYAIIQGCDALKEGQKYSGNGTWWLRSPYYRISKCAGIVEFSGRTFFGNIDFISIGVVPAVCIRLN